MRYCFKLTLFALFPLLGVAQEYQFQVRPLSMKDGLPNDYVTHAMQSSDGYAWISSNFNLSRFDGYEVREFAQDEKYRYPPYATFEDVNGLLWVCHFATPDQADWLEKNDKTLEIFDPIRDVKTPFDEKFGKKFALKTSHIAYLTTDARRNIWIVTVDGNIFRYDGFFTKMAHIPKHYIQLKGSSFFKMSIQEDQIWILIGEKYILLNINNQGIVKKIELDDDIDWMCVDTEKRLWLSSRNKPVLWRKSLKGNFEKIRLEIPESTLVSKGNRHVFEVNARTGHIWYSNFGSCKKMYDDFEKRQ